MRILFCSYDYPPRLGGQARLARHIVQHLRADFDVTVVTSRKTDPHERGTLAMLHSERSILRNAVSLRRRVGTKYDLVFAADCDISGRIASRYSLFTGIPMIQLCHGLDLQRMRRRSLGGTIDRMLLRRSLCTVANSTFTMEAAKRAFAPGEIRVIHPGVDIAEALPSPIESADTNTGPERPGNPAELLSVARLVKRKGHETVLHALSGLDESFVYRIIGDGPERKRLEDLSQSLGLAGKVRFLGAVDDREKLQHYARCHIFVLTPHVVDTPLWMDFEGFGIVYLEANAYGKPVVASRSGGVPDAVRDGMSGVLVEPQSPGEVRDALRTMIQDRALYDRLSRGAGEWASRFDWQRVGPEYTRLVKEVVDHPARTG